MKNDKETDSNSNKGILERQEHLGEDRKLFPGKYQCHISTFAFQKVLEFHDNPFMELGI